MKKRLYPEPHIIKVNQHPIELTHCTELMFPQNGITKGNLVDYYLTIAPLMLPFLKNRPLSLQRFTHGITHEGFYQKEAGTYFPSWIRQTNVSKKSGGFTHSVVANNAATLAYLTNQRVVTYHTWLSHTDALDIPDRMIFDLDPSGTASFTDVRYAAQILYDYCTARSITPLCMTTGSRGLHVIIPLKREHNFDTVRAVARTIAEQCVQKHPTVLTLETHTKDRGNKIYIDVLRNGYAQTSVAPYSVRARPHAPVATPIAWKELFERKIRKSDQFTIKTVLKRIDKNPWDKNITRISLATLTSHNSDIIDQATRD